MTATTIGLIVMGLILLFAGAALSVYGVALLGLLLGGAAGFVFAPTLGGFVGLEGFAAILPSVAIGGLIGVVLAYAVLSIAIGILSFIVGTFFGWAVIAPTVLDSAWYVDVGVGLGIGFAAAILATIFAKTVLIIITSAVGAALASMEITSSDLELAHEGPSLEPLMFEFTAPIFLGLFVLGILSQFGLFKFGYVTKLVGVIPGASVIRNRSENDQRQA